MLSKKHSGAGSSWRQDHATAGHSCNCPHEKIENDFVMACNTGNLTEVKALMKRGVKVFRDCPEKLAEATVNRVDDKGTSNLNIALSQNNKELGDFLLSHPQINVNGLPEGADEFPRISPLHCAAHHGNISALRKILSDPKLTTLNSKDTNGCTPLMEAVRKAQPEAVRELLEVKGVDLDTKSSCWLGSGAWQMLLDGGDNPDLSLEEMAKVCIEKLNNGQWTYRFNTETMQNGFISEELAKTEKKNYMRIIKLLKDARNKRKKCISAELSDKMKNLKCKGQNETKPNSLSTKEKPNSIMQASEIKVNLSKSEGFNHALLFSAFSVNKNKEAEEKAVMTLQASEKSTESSNNLFFNQLLTFSQEAVTMKKEASSKKSADETKDCEKINKVINSTGPKSRVKSSIEKEVKSSRKESRKCQNCGDGGHIKKCRNCRKAFYCGEACQAADWQAHRPMCIINRELNNGSKDHAEEQ